MKSFVRCGDLGRAALAELLWKRMEGGVFHVRVREGEREGGREERRELYMEREREKRTTESCYIYSRSKSMRSHEPYQV